MPDDPIAEIRALGSAPPNYDEGNLSELPPPLLAARGTIGAEARQEWLARFAAESYDSDPPPPAAIEIERQPIPSEQVERILIRLRVAGSSFEVDAALWLPANAAGPVPVIVGLDFKGPIGILMGRAFRSTSRRGCRSFSKATGASPMRCARTSAHRSADRAADRRRLGGPCELLWLLGSRTIRRCSRAAVFDPLLGDAVRGARPGAIALWGWAISRLVDVGGAIPRTTRCGRRRRSLATRQSRPWAAAERRADRQRPRSTTRRHGASLSGRNYGETRRHVGARSALVVAGCAPVGRAARPASAAGLGRAAAALLLCRRRRICGPIRGARHRVAGGGAGLGGVELPLVGSVFVPGAEVARGALAWHFGPVRTISAPMTGIATCGTCGSFRASPPGGRQSPSGRAPPGSVP